MYYYWFRFLPFIALALFWGLIMADNASAELKADFYVATNGNDLWSGTLSAPNEMRTDGPFASIECAQRAARSLRKQNSSGMWLL